MKRTRCAPGSPNSNDKLGQLVEDYNAAGEQLKQTKAAAASTQTALQQAQKDLSQAQLRLGDRLVQIYKRGRISVLDMLLGAASFSDLATRVGILQHVGGQDAQLVSRSRLTGTRCWARRPPWPFS